MTVTYSGNELPNERARSQGLWKRRLAVFGNLFVLVALAMAQYRNYIYQISCDRMQRDFGGGPGGRNITEAECESGFVAVGFHVRTGEYFNQAWLDCAPLRSDGTFGEERRMTARAGSAGGNTDHDAGCSSGRVLRGIKGRAGESVDEVVGECSYLKDIGDRFEAPSTDLTASVIRPKPGGKPAEAACPAGYAMVGFQSKSGEWIDHLWVQCSEIRRTY